jgi:hypothetical protein
MHAENAKRNKDMSISTNQILVGTRRQIGGLALVIAVAAPSAQANLINDPGFETNPLTTISNSLNDFATYQGQWGVENASITGTVGLVVPFQGVKMLSMLDDGLIATQATQTIDVTSYASLIDSGSAKFNLGALFNVDSVVSAAIGGVALQFFSASNFGSQIGSFASGSFTLDANPATWQPFSLNGAIPVSTRWLVAQVLYNDASLQSQPGYVDATDLSIIPEPTTMSLLAFGGLLMKRVGKRGKPCLGRS